MDVDAVELGGRVRVEVGDRQSAGNRIEDQILPVRLAGHTGDLQRKDRRGIRWVEARYVLEEVILSGAICVPSFFIFRRSGFCV